MATKLLNGFHRGDHSGLDTGLGPEHQNAVTALGTSRQVPVAVRGNSDAERLVSHLTRSLAAVEEQMRLGCLE